MFGSSYVQNRNSPSFSTFDHLVEDASYHFNVFYLFFGFALLSIAPAPNVLNNGAEPTFLGWLVLVIMEQNQVRHSNILHFRRVGVQEQPRYNTGSEIPSLYCRVGCVSICERLQWPLALPQCMFVLLKAALGFWEHIQKKMSLLT